ncbi:unnamed protein product [Rhizoctonia solani]|uniref:Xylanolytic transcriptional activator regulatory domain-containing protein n=1 Tax=Rhizoctonia solani TaxID=456999 RepID=A0A8H3ECT0_9AGAM|nr:unnamed protein product [Rhizoctonia solani]
MNVSLLVVAVNTRTRLIEPGLNRYRIKELEAQIRALEEKKTSSSASEFSSSTSSDFLSPSPSLSLGTSSTSPSRGASRTPITPTLGSAEDIFPPIIAPSSPSSAYSTPDIIPNYSKSTGPDPPPDVVGKLAMTMFGLYYYFKGRLLEGHVHTAHATRLAVALGLHKLDSRIFRPSPVGQAPKQPFGTQLWRPRDPVELGEAINLWWSCNSTELAGSTLNGLPPCVSLEDDVTTVWPRLLSDFEYGQPLPDDNYSVNSLLDPRTSSIVVSVSRDNVKSLIAKSYILMVWAAKLDVERVSNHQGSDDWWIRFEQCDQAINQFMETMPPVRLSRNVEELAYLIIVHTAIYCSQLQLHNALAEFELAMGAQRYPNGRNPDGSLGGISYARCNEACRATVLAAAVVVDIDLSYMVMFIGIAWVCVAEVLIREIPRLKRSGFVAEAREKEQQLGLLETCMDRLVATYPVLSLQLNQLQTIKAQQLYL